MIKFGIVTEYDNTTGMADIEYVRPDACDKCGACAGASRKETITLKADCHEGDWVKVELPEGRFLGATALAYALPLGGFAMGLGLGYFLGGGQDLITVLGAAVGVGFAFTALKMIDRQAIDGHKEWVPQVTAVYHEKPGLDDIGCDNFKS